MSVTVRGDPEAAFDAKHAPRGEQFAGPAFDLVVVGASLGGLEAVGRVLSGLPADFPAAVLVVQHLHPTYPSRLAALWSRRSLLPVEQATHGARLAPGRVYVAPPGRHLLVSADRTLALSDSPRVQFVRPAADRLFESAAAFDSKALAVVLTGRGADGARGAEAVRAAGGAVLAQDPATARARGMPGAVIAAGAANLVLPLEAIPRALVALVMVPGSGSLFGLPRAA